MHRYGAIVIVQIIGDVVPAVLEEHFPFNDALEHHHGDDIRQQEGGIPQSHDLHFRIVPEDERWHIGNRPDEGDHPDGMDGVPEEGRYHHDQGIAGQVIGQQYE